MNINRKIEEIRQKPEHERLRYVWGSVAVCMVFVLLIWILSVKISLQKTQDQSQAQPLSDIGKQLQDIKDAAPSLNDVNQLTTGTDNADTTAGNQPAADSSADNADTSQSGQ